MTTTPVTSETPEDPRWAAVCARDAERDGQFVYAVATTGVYCRPSCRARRPRRENVSFHSTPEQAERAGFRACKRCRPEQPPRGERELSLVSELCRLLDAQPESIPLPELSRRAGVSSSHLHRIFKRVTGVTPGQYQTARRRERMRGELAGPGSITAAIHAVGYGSTSRFYETSASFLGMTPREYRRGGSGLRLRYAFGSSSLGLVLVATTERGVCAVSLGDDRAALERQLEQRFPRAERVPSEEELRPLVARVVASVEQPAAPADLPLDVRGTAFQARVWQALTRVPPGQTATYGELAAAIGAPGAARAVGRACGENPLAVLVPCHRVVGRDGGLTGYRWGSERKRELLERERSPSPIEAGACDAPTSCKPESECRPPTDRRACPRQSESSDPPAAPG